MKFLVLSALILLAACSDDDGGAIQLPAISASYRVGNSPSGVAIDPAGTRVVTANQGSDNASVIDLASGTVTTVEAGTNAAFVLISPDGTKAYITNRQVASGTVTEIDLLTRSVSRTITVAAGPGRGAFSGDGSFLLIPNGGLPPPPGPAPPNNISKIAVASGEVVGSVNATLPGSVIASPDRATFFVVLNTMTSIGLFTASDVSVTNVPTGGPNCSYAAFSPNGATVYTSCGLTDFVAQIDVAARALTRTITVGSSPGALAMNPAGTRLFVLRPSASTLSVIEAGGNVLAETVVSGTPRHVAVSNAAQYVLVTTEEGNLIVLDSSGTRVLNTLALGGTPSGFVLSPACACAAVSLSSTSEVVIVKNLP